MDEKLLPKNFFRKNKLTKFSAAQMAYYTASAEFTRDIEQVIFDVAKEYLSDERKASILQEREVIAQLQTADEVIRLMRKGIETANCSELCDRALTMQDELIPPMLNRFRTSAQDTYIEAAFHILANMERDYIEQLRAIYPTIRNPYAKSMACLAFGIHQQEDLLPLLLAEYERMRRDYPDERFEQGPLLAIYILYERA